VKEKYLQAKILKALREFGGWWVKYHVGPRYSTAGVPDIIGCYMGLFIGLEVKRPGQKPTELQKLTHDRIRQQGKGIVRVVYSVDDALTLLYAIKRRLTPNGKKQRQERA